MQTTTFQGTPIPKHDLLTSLILGPFAMVVQWRVSLLLLLLGAVSYFFWKHMAKSERPGLRAIQTTLALLTAQYVHIEWMFYRSGLGFSM